MYIENINPVIFTIGPFSLRVYGLMFFISFLTGFYYMRKHGKPLGLGEDRLIELLALIMVAMIIGARTVFVLANWDYFARNPELILRIDQGGLAFHGGLIGGFSAGLLYCRLKKIDWRLPADLAVPGIATGIILVRIANIFNQEILGREAAALCFERHPAQLYGSLIGLALLILHNQLARRENCRRGSLFWSFVLAYSCLRGIVEETFRLEPLAAWGYINDTWGVGFFTTVQLFTPALIILSLYMLKSPERS